MGGSLGDHRLEIQVPEDLPLVRVDASQVERVISNLLDNAGKYSPPGKADRCNRAGHGPGRQCAS